MSKRIYNLGLRNIIINDSMNYPYNNNNNNTDYCFKLTFQFEDIGRVEKYICGSLWK